MLDRAEALFQEIGLTKITYLLVPNFHAQGESDIHSGFREFISRPREFALSWFLHGYYHLEIEPESINPLSRPWEWLTRRVLCQSEGEFHSLAQDAAETRLAAAERVFTACLGLKPTGFVAPAWLFRRELLPLLARRGFHITESHTHIYDLRKYSQLRGGGQGSTFCPTITWAVSNSWMKYASLISAPLLTLVGSASPVLRIALHPSDFAHPEVVAQIRYLLKALLRKRQAAFYSDALSA